MIILKFYKKNKILITQFEEVNKLRNKIKEETESTIKYEEEAMII